MCAYQANLDHNSNNFEKIELEGGILYYCDSRKIREILQDNAVDFVVTSPPYWAIRDYGFMNQIGFGQDYKEYIRGVQN